MTAPDDRASSREVTLRDVVEADLPVLHRHQADPVACRMAAFKPRDGPAFLDHWRKILADASVVKKTILFRGQVAGNVASFVHSGERHVGYWLGRDHWGKGIATAALTQFLRCDPTRPLHVRVATSNVASIRVLEKCGFVTVRHERSPANERCEEADERIMVLPARA